MKKLKKSLGLGLMMVGLLGMNIGSTGCYGSFTLTKKVYKWNGEVSDNKWAKEGMFLLIYIIPVYGLAMLGDGIIFNSVEFWGGKNPFADSETTKK